MAQLLAAGGFQTRNLAESLISAEALARWAAALDGGDAEAHATLGAALCSCGDYEGLFHATCLARKSDASTRASRHAGLLPDYID
jgi:hypothetical protein